MHVRIQPSQTRDNRPGLSQWIRSQVTTYQLNNNTWIRAGSLTVSHCMRRTFITKPCLNPINLCRRLIDSLISHDWRVTLPPAALLLHLHFTYPLTAGVCGAPQVISQPVSFIFLFLQCPLGLGELQASPFPDVVFLPLFFCLPCFLPPFHCALP